MPQVQLFVTCLVDTIFPRTGQAVVSILRRLGISVEFPRLQTCCGQPPFNAGLSHESRPIAEHTIRVFEATTGDIVIPSGSCAHMLKHNYPELFAGDHSWLPRAQSLAARVYEFTEYLVDKLEVTDVGARWQGVLAYHPSCHTLRGMGIDRQPRRLLASVRDAQVVELPHAEDCCGFGGIFSMEHPELSTEMLNRKIACFESLRPGSPEPGSPATMVLAESGCLLHMSGGLHHQKKEYRVMHIAEILDHQ